MGALQSWANSPRSDGNFLGFGHGDLLLLPDQVLVAQQLVQLRVAEGDMLKLKDEELKPF